MSNKRRIAFAIAACLFASAAWAAIQRPVHPGDRVSYFDQNHQLVGEAWIPCTSTAVQSWGVATSDAYKYADDCSGVQ